MLFIQGQVFNFYSCDYAVVLMLTCHLTLIVFEYLKHYRYKYEELEDGFNSIIDIFGAVLYQVCIFYTQMKFLLSSEYDDAIGARFYLTEYEEDQLSNFEKYQANLAHLTLNRIQCWQILEI